MDNTDIYKELSKRISELIAERSQEEATLVDLERFIESLPPESVEQMSRSASESKGRRMVNDEVATKIDFVKDCREKAAKKRENFALLWAKICDLQAELRSLAPR